MNFGKLIHRRIIKIIATIYQILRLKCTKFLFWLELSSGHVPLGQLYDAPPDPLARGRGGKGKGMEGLKGRRRGEVEGVVASWLLGMDDPNANKFNHISVD